MLWDLRADIGAVVETATDIKISNALAKDDNHTEIINTLSRAIALLNEAEHLLETGE